MTELQLFLCEDVPTQSFSSRAGDCSPQVVCFPQVVCSWQVQNHRWWRKLATALVLCALFATGAAGPKEARAQAEPSGQDPGLKTRTVEAEHELYASDKTPQEARREAIDRAQAEAIRQAIGTQVRAGRRTSTVETGEEVVSRFSQVVRTGASGRVVSSTVLEERRPKRGGEIFQYVRIRATVRPATGRPDPGFRADVSLKDESKTFVARGDLEESDEIIAEISVTEDAHVTLFSVTPDTLQVIWPNALSEDTFVAGGTTVEFPPPGLRAQGLRLRASTPERQGRATERLVAVATKQKVPFQDVPEYEVEDGALNTTQAGVEALNRWLVEVPLGQRAIGSVTYDVLKEGNP